MKKIITLIVCSASLIAASFQISAFAAKKNHVPVKKPKIHWHGHIH